MDVLPPRPQTHQLLQTDVNRLADQVYDRIVRRIKRERELKGR